METKKFVNISLKSNTLPLGSEQGLKDYLKRGQAVVLSPPEKFFKYNINIPVKKFDDVKITVVTHLHQGARITLVPSGF